jgi:formamidopyrimidine-DNA glycosylase
LPLFVLDEPYVPELPEVEIARRNLVTWTAGGTIHKVVVSPVYTVEGDLSALAGHPVTAWERCGKTLRTRIGAQFGLISHLGMTGKWVKDAPVDRPHRHVTLHLNGAQAKRVSLIDPRRFSYMASLPWEAIKVHPRWLRLGPDALDSHIDGTLLRQRCGKSRQAWKVKLMDQGVIAGLGNIAVIEMGYRARLHPHRPCVALSMDEWNRLAQAMHDHLAYVLDAEDGEEIRYLGESGAQNPFLCYGRAGESCLRCEQDFIRLTLAKRPTHLCPGCQHA